MSLKSTLITFCFLCAAITLNGQHIAVQSFRILENDLTAQVTHPKIDQNGNKAALIKVVTTQTGFEFDGGMLGVVAVEQKTAEIWVYIPGRAKAITIKHPQLGILRNYTYPIPIEAARTYEMVLVSGTVETIVRPAEIPTQWLIIESVPSGADVYINDQPAGQTPYQSELPLGRYTFRVVKELYLPEAGIVELKNTGGNQTLSLTLKPNFGTIQLNSSPEQGAEVILNGVKTGKLTPCTLETVPTGENTIVLKREWYATTTKKVQITAGQTLPLTIAMAPTYVDATIKTDDEAEIFINGISRGIGPWKGRLNPGVYTFEARRKNHRNATEKRTVEIGKNFELSLHPSPITGSLKVVTTPHGAEILLSGKSSGTTPATLRNILIGEYQLELRKKGYASVIKTITVEEAKTIEINETLSSGKEITITSTPSGANVFINNQKVGQTPLTVALTFGTHQLKVSNKDLEVQRSIEVSQTGQANWDFNLIPKKKVTIDSNQPSNVYINRDFYGKTPVEVELKFGNYELRLEPENRDYEVITQTLVVNSNSATIVEIILSLSQEALKRKAQEEKRSYKYTIGSDYIDKIYEEDKENLGFYQILTQKGIWGIGYVGVDKCFFVPPMVAKYSAIYTDDYPPILSAYAGASVVGEMIIHPHSVTIDYFSVHFGFMATNLTHRVRFMAEISGGLKGRSAFKNYYYNFYGEDSKIVRTEYLNKDLRIPKLPWMADAKVSLDIYFTPKFALTFFGGMIFSRKLKWYIKNDPFEGAPVEVRDDLEGMPKTPYIEGKNAFYGVGVRLF